MTTSMFNAKLLPTTLSVAVVVVRAVVVVGNVPQRLGQHAIPRPRRRKSGGVSRLSTPWKVGPEKRDWSTVSSGTASARKRFTGAEFVAHFLEQQGIKIMAGIPGGSILPVYDASSQSTQIRRILAHHKQGAGFIAQRMARTDGRPAVCMACSGSGATNLVTTTAGVRLDFIPLIYTTSQVPASIIGVDAFQEVDTYGISIPIAEHNYLVRHTEELPQVMSDAFRIAQSGHPGPIWIDAPKDVQTTVFEIETQSTMARKAAAPAFSEESIRDAVAMINTAKRPVLYLGDGVISAPVRVRELIEKA